MTAAGTLLSLASVLFPRGERKNRRRQVWARIWHTAAILLIGLGCLQAQTQPTGTVATTNAAFFPVDLSRFVTTVFSNVPQGNMWSALPRGEQTFHGVPFKIDGKFEVTGLYVLHSLSAFFPPKVAGIPIGRKAERIVLLHGTGWTELDGTPMAKMVLHYASGREESLRIAYGLHVRSWYEDRSESKKSLFDPNSVAAWNGSEDDMDRGTPFRLYKTTFENPLPNEVIKSIDFVTLFSQAAPIILGMTLQNGGPPLARVEGPTRWLARKSLAQPDNAYTRGMSVRAVDASSSATLTNATLWVTLTDDQGPNFFGAYPADAQGVIRFDFPPRETIALNLLIKSPNRAPLALSPARDSEGHFPREITARLGPGVTIGGVVQDDTGKPVENAEILVSSISRAKSKVYTQMDFDQVRSDKAGHWQSSVLPRGFSNLVLQVSHPDFRAATFQEPGTNSLIRSNIITSEQLLAQKSVVSLRRGLLVQGTVKGSNAPLANAEVYFFEDLNSPRSKRTMRTGADGRFSFVSTADSGEGALAVLARGFAPKYEAFFVEAATNPFEFQMENGSRLQARIIDNEQSPVAGAVVKLEQWHNNQLVNFRTVTDTNGGFTWENAPEGSLTFSFTKTNFFTMRSSMAVAAGSSSSMTTYHMRRMSAVSGAVVDAETKRPIDEFTIIKGHSYSRDEPIRWNRYSGSVSKGRYGRYNVRLDEYSSQGQSKIMIEAPGYLPMMSEPFRKQGWYTNDFALKKGVGLVGTIVLPNGDPAANCSVTIVDAGSSVFMDQPGDFRPNGSAAEYTRTDAQGKFKFPPKAEVQTLVAANEKGCAQLQTDRIPADGKIALQPWGQVKGVIKVGKRIEPGQMAALQSFYHRYGDETGRRSPPISLYLRAPLDADGNFVFDKVPPGDRQAFLQYEFRTSRGGFPTSHGVPVEVKSGETSVVTVGGSGRLVIGTIKVVNGDPTEVDWRRDQHYITLRMPGDPQNEAVMMPPTNSDTERQKFWEERENKMREFWRTDKGRELERKFRNYALVFDTNGNFRIDSVPAGTYDLHISLTDSDEDGSYRQIGYLNHQFTVPEGPADQAFDSGSHELVIRRQLRVGQNAPSLQTNTIDGKAFNLADYKGKYVLVDFCAKWNGSYGMQMANLKSLYDSYGKDGRLMIISLSTDYEETQARELMAEFKVPWPFCYIGNWSQTQIPARFGVEGMPHAILISPDGKVVAKNLQGTYMKTTVRRLVDSKVAIRG